MWVGRKSKVFYELCGLLEYRIIHLFFPAISQPLSLFLCAATTELLLSTPNLEKISTSSSPPSPFLPSFNPFIQNNASRGRRQFLQNPTHHMLMLMLILILIRSPNHGPPDHMKSKHQTHSFRRRRRKSKRERERSYVFGNELFGGDGGHRSYGQGGFGLW